MKKRNVSFIAVIYLSKLPGSGVARAFPGGRLAHLEGQNEEEHKKSLRKSKKTWSKFEGKNEESGTLAHPGL